MFKLKNLFLMILVSTALLNGTEIDHNTGPVPKVHNLMWIYERFGLDDGANLSPSGLIFTQAIKWAQLNPGFQIHLNYDGIFISSSAVQATLRSILSSGHGQQIFLRNLRQHPSISGENSSAFSADSPMACKSDLSRALKSHGDLTTGNFVFSSYADLDVKPCNLQEIIDSHQADFADYGMVLARENRKHSNGNAPRFENCFHIFARNKVFLDCLNRVLIQPSIIRLRLFAHAKGYDEAVQNISVVKEFQKLLRIKDLKNTFNTDTSVEKEFVYAKFEPVLIAVHNIKQSLSFIVQIDGYKQFWWLNFVNGTVIPGGSSLDSFLCNPRCEYGTNGNAINGQKLKPGGAKIFDEEGLVYVPTVPMEFPPSKLLQDD